MNPRLWQAWELARAAQYSWKMAQSTYHPEITFSEELSYNIQRGPIFSGTNGGAVVGTGGGVAASGAGTSVGGGTTTTTTTTNQTQRFRSAMTTFSMSFLLFDFGVRKGAVTAARENFFAAAYLGEQALQDAIFNTLTTYYQYFASLAQQEASRSDLQDAEVAYESAKARFEAGVSARTDLLQLLAQLSAAQLAYQQAQGNALIAQAQLARTVGLPAQAPILIAKPAVETWDPSLLPRIEEMISLALSLRRDVAAAYANYLSSRGSWIAAQAEALPTVSLQANWTQTSLFRRPRSSSSETFTSLLTLEVPLYRGGYYSANAARARATMEAANLNNSDVAAQAILDAVNAYHQVYTAAATLSSARDYLGYAVENFNALLATYRHGVAAVTDLVTAEKTQSDARAQYVAAQAGWLQAIANAAYATGSLQRDAE
jgi:outer membrane protein